MTEDEWLTGTDPQRMLAWLTGPEYEEGWSRSRQRPVSERKLRLFACACCRACWSRLTDPRSRYALEVGERFADGDASEEERQRSMMVLLADPEINADDAPDRDDFFLPAWAANHSRRLPENAQHYLQRATRLGLARATQAALLRDIFGNPWQPVPLPWMQDPPVNGELSPPYCPWLTWQGGTVPRMAEVIYRDRTWGELPVLADALQEAGCEVEDLLTHLRGPEPHVRGCWCVDLILNRE
jgi:hypothetical protein